MFNLFLKTLGLVLLVISLTSCSGKKDDSSADNNGSAATNSSSPYIADMQSSKAAQRSLRILMLDCLNYESRFMEFPADILDDEGKPLLSWRVALLPFLNQKKLWDAIRKDEPWDSEHNCQFWDQIPEAFKSRNPYVALDQTTFRGIGGKGGLFEGPKGTKLGSIPDGASNTIAIVNVQDSLAVNWMKPGPLDVETIDFNQLFGAEDYFSAAFVDAAIHKISRDLDKEQLRHLLIRNDGHVVEFR